MRFLLTAATLVAALWAGSAHATVRRGTTGPPTMRDTLGAAIAGDARVDGSAERIEGTRPPEDYRSGQPASGLPAAADTRFAELALLDVGNPDTLLARLGFTGCGARRGPLTYLCPNGDAPDPSTLGRDVVAVHLALAGDLPAALAPGTKLGFALITQNTGAPQAPASGSLTGGSDAYRTVFQTSGSTVTPVYQFWQFPWAPVAATSDPPFNLQILDDRGGVTWLLDPAVFSARNVTGLRPKTFVEGGAIANPIPDLPPSNPTIYHPWNPSGLSRIRITNVAGGGSTTGVSTTEGGADSNLGWWLLGGAGVLVVGGGIAMRRRNGDTDVATTLMLDEQWTAIVTANEAAEQQVATASNELGERLGKFFADYGTNVQTFARAYSRGVHGLDILEETRKENEGRIAIAQIADVVVNLVQLFQVASAVKGGVQKGWRWYRGRQVAAQNRRIVANLDRRFPELDAMTRAGLRGTPTDVSSLPGVGYGPWTRATMPADLPNPPEWFTPGTAIVEAFGGSSQAFWHMGQMAEELGANLQQMVSTPRGVEGALAQLRLQVAAARGVPMLPLDAYLRLFNLERAAAGKTAFNLEDLRWFYNMAQQDPNLNILGTMPGQWDVAGAQFLDDVPAAVDGQMLQGLRGLLQDANLAQQVANTPVGMRGVVDVVTADGSVVRLAGDLGEVPPGPAAFLDTLAPPVAGGPIVGIGAGQGVVQIPPTIAPGARLPFGSAGDVTPTLTGGEVPPTGFRDVIPPTFTGRAADVTPTWTGGPDEIPQTWMGDPIPPTWVGSIEDLTPTWRGAFPDAGGTFPPPGVSIPAPAATVGFDGNLTLPPGVLDPALAPGVMRLDAAAEFASTVIDEGRDVLASGTYVSQLARALPPETPVAVVAAGPAVGSVPVVRTGLVGQFTDSVGRSFDDVASTIRDPWFQEVNELIGTGEDAAFLFGTGAGAIQQGGVFGEGALVDPAALLTLARTAGNLVLEDTVFVSEYGAGRYVPIVLPGLDVGMQATVTPTGVSVFDGLMPAYSAPSAPMPSGILNGFTGGLGAQLGTLGLAVDPTALDAARTDLITQTSALMGARGGLFRTPDDFLDELDDYGVTRTDFSFGFWTVADGDSWWGEWGWNYVLLSSNPTETLLKRLPIIGLGDLMTEQVKQYYEVHVDDLVAMNGALSSMITDLEWTLEHLPAWSAPLVAALGALDDAMSAASAFADANPDWVAAHPGVVETKLARDAETRAHVAQSLASLQTLGTRLAPMIAWLKELKSGPGGVYKRNETLLEPTSILRVSGAYLQAIDALTGVLLLTPPPDDAPAPPTQGGYKPSIDEMIEQKERERASWPPEDYHKYEVDDIPRPTPEQIREEYGDR